MAALPVKATDDSKFAMFDVSQNYLFGGEILGDFLRNDDETGKKLYKLILMFHSLVRFMI